MAGKLEIDIETGERICLLSLKDHRKYLKKELKAHKKGAWMHPEDVDKNHMMIKQINSILDYYGGELYGEREAGKPYQKPTMVEAFERLEAYFLEIRKTSTQESD